MATTNYVRLGSRIIGERQVGGSRTDFGTDALGSVTSTISGGAVANVYSYKPFGAQLSKAGTGVDPAFTWVGSKGYRATSLPFSEKYVRARHFSTILARWSTKDPRWPDQLAYTYVGQNAISFVDPSGLGTPGPIPVNCVAEIVAASLSAGGEVDGFTDCWVGTGQVYTCYASKIDPCLGDCIVQHETVHQWELSSCCSKAGECAKHHPVAICQPPMDWWMAAVENWTECDAWTVTVTCLDKQAKANLCYNGYNAPWGCCSVIMPRLAEAKSNVKRLCPGTYRECPFDSKGKIRAGYAMVHP